MDKMRETISRDDVRRFYHYVKPYRWRALGSILLSIPVGSMDAVTVALLRPFTDQIMFTTIRDGTVPNVAYFPILIVILTIAQSLCKHFANYLSTWVGKKISMDLKSDLFDRLLHHDTAMFDHTTSGEILQYYSSDASYASETLLGNVTFMVNRLFSSIALVCVLFWNSWILALVAVVALALGVLPLNRVRRKIKVFIKDSVKAGAGISTNYNEAFIGNRTITAYNLYDQQRERLQQTMQYLFRLTIKTVQRTGAMSVAMHAAIAIGTAAILYLQGILFVNNLLTPGSFISFMAALLLLYNPMKAITNNYGKIQSGLMSIQRCLDRLDDKPTIVSRPNAVTLDGVRDAVRYEDVSFSYEPGKPVLRHVSLELKAGNSMAFVGNSGGGKTTLANLLPRLYDVCLGRITIDGVDIRDIELTNLRNLMAIVFQDNFLFGGSIGENIAIGKSGATDEEMRRAIQAACLEEFIGGLAQGLDTPIGERGCLLSGGQKQRVAIARAFLKDAPIVILDEATSSLDNESEKVVQKAIENLMLNKTVIIIAHRLSTVINADAIAVIKDGEMVEYGKHGELMAKGGVYASLYRTQLT